MFFLGQPDMNSSGILFSYHANTL